MDGKEFHEQVAPEVTGRLSKNANLTSQQLDDWFHFLQPFSVEAGAGNLRAFFRDDKVQFHRAKEFGAWLKQQGREAVPSAGGCFFPVDALVWPRVSMALFTLPAEDWQDRDRYGWIERHRQNEGNRDAKNDIGNWWQRHKNGLFSVRAFTPAQAEARRIKVSLLGELFGAQRRDWLKGANTRAEYPAGLDELLEGRAGALPGLY